MLVTDPHSVSSLSAFVMDGVSRMSFRHQNSAEESTGCHYKSEEGLLTTNFKPTSRKLSDYNAGVELWTDKYYDVTHPSPPPLRSHPVGYNVSATPTKLFSPNATSMFGCIDGHMTAGSLYSTSSPYTHTTHQPPVKTPYYNSAGVTPSANQHAQAQMLQWQQTLHHQQHHQQPQPQHSIQQYPVDRLSSHSNHNVSSATHHEASITNSTATAARFDALLRTQHTANYLLSFNENVASNWCQSTNSATKDNAFHPSSAAAKNVCPLCGKSYARPSTLKTHMRIHSGERPFHCKVCNKSFSQAANLTAHVRVHSGEKPFSCAICNKTFSQSSSVTTHMRTHSGDRPYKCPVCRKGFSDSSTLTKHLRIHSGEKPYQCDFCSMSFSQSGNLNRHMKVHELSKKSESTASTSRQPSP